MKVGAKRSDLVRPSGIVLLECRVRDIRGLVSKCNGETGAKRTPG